jgi:hypothetical protein
VKPKRKSLWDSRQKTDEENEKKNRALYAYFKGRKTELDEFLYVSCANSFREQKKKAARMNHMLDDE